MDHRRGVVLGLSVSILFGLLTELTMADPPELGSFAPPLMQRADIPGLGVADVFGEEIKVSVFGDAKIGEQPVTEETVFEAASLTKPVVAFLVMRLVEKEVLQLDDVLVDLLPTLPLPEDDARSKQVTVRMALAHMSGLDGPDDRVLSFSEDPGTTFRYYPAGYRLVQRVVEHLESTSLEALAIREVFGPLGMNSSSLVYKTEFASRLATRHNILSDPIERVRNPESPANAAASLMTTAGDYAKFLRAMLQAKGLSEASVETMLKPQIEVDATNGGVAWGIGWGLEPQQGTFFHWGDDGAAKCFTIGSRSEAKAMVYFANSFNGMFIAGEMAGRTISGERPAVAWLNYGRWDKPLRLARRDILRAFVDDGADAGMRAFEDYEERYESLDMAEVANWMAWLLDIRSLHEERIEVLNWQVERDPANVDLLINLARSQYEIGDVMTSIGSFRAARTNADQSLHGYLDGQISWIRDELLAAANAESSPSLEENVIVGTYDVRTITSEDGTLWYQREGRPRYRMRWMHDATFSLEDLDSFRLRFVLKDGRAEKVVGFDANGNTDESLRSLIGR